MDDVGDAFAGEEIQGIERDVSLWGFVPFFWAFGEFGIGLDVHSNRLLM
jgi:hypothetical protein